MEGSIMYVDESRLALAAAFLLLSLQGVLGLVLANMSLGRARAKG